MRNNLERLIVVDALRGPAATPDEVEKALHRLSEWTFADFQWCMRRTMNLSLTEREGILHAGAGVASDGGEVLSAAKAHFFYNKPLDAVHDKVTGATVRECLIEECGDVLWFVAEMAERLGLNMETFARSTMQKLLVRYPEQYSDAQAQARVDKGGHGR